MAEGTDPLARACEVLAAKFTAAKYDYGDDGEGEYRELNTPADRVDQGMFVHFTAGDGHRSFRAVTPAEVVEALAAAGLLRDQPALTRTGHRFRVVWGDGSITPAHGVDDAYVVLEGTPPGATGRIEQCTVEEYRVTGPWRPVEDTDR